MNDRLRMLVLRVTIVLVLHLGPWRPAGRRVEIKAW
jgi:hypothetical protein